MKIFKKNVSYKENALLAPPLLMLRALLARVQQKKESSCVVTNNFNAWIVFIERTSTHSTLSMGRADIVKSRIKTFYVLFLILTHNWLNSIAELTLYF